MDALNLLTQILSHSQLKSGSKYSFNPSPQGLWHLCCCVVWLSHYSCAGSFPSGFTFVPTFMKLFIGDTCQQLRACCSCRAPEFDSQHPHLVAHNLLYGIYRMQHHFLATTATFKRKPAQRYRCLQTINHRTKYFLKLFLYIF